MIYCNKSSVNVVPLSLSQNIFLCAVLTFLLVMERDGEMPP